MPVFKPTDGDCYVTLPLRGINRMKCEIQENELLVFAESEYEKQKLQVFFNSHLEDSGDCTFSVARRPEVKGGWSFDLKVNISELPQVQRSDYPFSFVMKFPDPRVARGKKFTSK